MSQHGVISALLALVLLWVPMILMIRIAWWLPLVFMALVVLFLWHKVRYVDRAPLVVAPFEMSADDIVRWQVAWEAVMQDEAGLCLQRVALDENVIPDDTAASEDQWAAKVEAFLADMWRHQDERGIGNHRGNVAGERGE